MVRKVLVIFVVVAFAGRLLQAATSDEVDFNFQIRPILSDRCFKCHGPDPKSRKADLRLDMPEAATALRDKKAGTHAIVPGKPDKSEVVRRITTTDPDDLMPPPDSHLSLSKEEIALLTQWIAQGAEYKTHWAFLPVQKITPPKLERSRKTGTPRSVRNPIDQFVLARLQKENLQPAPEAGKETLIRRLALDLTGLPPTPKEIDAFLNDASPNASENLMERYLASPTYGEHMANDWLDLARYADTYGYQADADCDLSAWRDWVIGAFNKNLPYDKFATWQVAGDLLPDATDEQILATAFNRLHRQTNEGGSVEEEFRSEYVSDRLHTFGTAFLGMTFECSRCHDHKYDPIKQKDYYQMTAFLDKIDESGLYSHFTRAIPTPTLLLYKEGAKEKHAALKKQIADAEAKIKQVEKTARVRFESWQAGLASPPLADSVQPIVHFAFEQIDSNKTPNAFGTNSATLNDKPKQVEGRVGEALKFDGESSVVSRGMADFKRTDPFSFSLWIQPTEQQERAVIFHHSRAWTDSGSRGYELILEKGKPTFALIHFWPGNAIGIRAHETIPLNEWTQLTLTYDGSSRASGLKIFVNGNAAEVEILHDTLSKDIMHRAEWGDSEAGSIPLTLAARFRDAGFKNGLIDEFQIFDRCLTPLEIAANGSGANETLNAEKTQRLANPVPSDSDLFTYYLHRHDAGYQAAAADLKKLREEENSFANDIPEIMVMKESPTPRQTHLLKRGAYDAPGEPVEPGTPEGIFPFPKNYPRNRLGLARWLTDPKNPLTARVAVNRIWKMHFGRGLVATPEDFGSQGQLPSHPELLDWLAGNFVKTGWDVKKLHRLILTSATYRQSSVASAQAVAVDPDNRLLASGPKQRLQAEEIRDSALAVSGLLSSKVGGQAVKPYQPAGLWEQSGTGKSYAQDKGEKLYRRSLYTFRRRTSPPPSMLIFDGTSREVCTAKRETTTTPLQALVLLNDPQFIEASRVLAEKLISDKASDLQSQVEGAFRQVIGRTPQPREQEILRQLYHEQLETFAANPEAADKYLAIGEHPRDAQLASEKVAALSVLVNTLMNYDEFVMKR